MNRWSVLALALILSACGATPSRRQGAGEPEGRFELTQTRPIQDRSARPFVLPSPEASVAVSLEAEALGRTELRVEVNGRALVVPGRPQFVAFDTLVSNLPSRRHRLDAKWGHDTEGAPPRSLPAGQAALWLNWSGDNLFPDMDPSAKILTMGGYLYVGQGEDRPVAVHNLNAPPSMAERYDFLSEAGWLHGAMWLRQSLPEGTTPAARVRVDFQLEQPEWGASLDPGEQPWAMPTFVPATSGW